MESSGQTIRSWAGRFLGGTANAVLVGVLGEHAVAVSVATYKAELLLWVVALASAQRNARSIMHSI